MSRHRSELTFEQRIDRLTERHEALVQTVALVARNSVELQSMTRHHSEVLHRILEATARLAKVAGRRVAGLTATIEAE